MPRDSLTGMKLVSVFLLGSPQHGREEMHSGLFPLPDDCGRKVEKIELYRHDGNQKKNRERCSLRTGLPNLDTLRPSGMYQSVPACSYAPLPAWLTDLWTRQAGNPGC